MRISLDPVRKKEVSMVVAILFILVFVLPVISTHGEAASPTFSATRSISPDDIAPGSTFNVRVILNQNLNQMYYLQNNQYPGQHKRIYL